MDKLSYGKNPQTYKNWTQATEPTLLNLWRKE